MHCTYLGSIGKESFGIGLLGLAVSGESLVSDLGNVDTSNADGGGGADSVNLVNALEGHSVDLVGTSHEEQAGLELLKENDSLSSESAAEEDENAARLETLSKLGSVVLLAVGFSLSVVGGVPSELFDHLTYV